MQPVNEWNIIEASTSTTSNGIAGLCVCVCVYLAKWAKAMARTGGWEGWQEIPIERNKPEEQLKCLANNKYTLNANVTLTNFNLVFVL